VHEPSLPALAREVLAAAGLLLRQLCAGLTLAVTAYAAGRTLLGLAGATEPGPGVGAGTGQEPGAGSVAADSGSPAGPPPPGLAVGGGLEMAALATTLGLVAVASLGLLLGLAGLLEPLPVLLVLAAIHLASLPVWRSWLSRIAWRSRLSLPSMPQVLRRFPGPAGRCRDGREVAGEAGARQRRLAWLAAGTGVLLPMALLTLYPPTAFDATLYHLPYARAFAASGSLPFLTDLRVPIFPQLMEMLFALMLLFAGELATQAVALLATMLTVALVLVWGRRFSSAAGWIAAAAYAGSPLVVYLAGTAYVEPGLVLFATAAFYSVARWLEGPARAVGQAAPAGRASGADGWLTLAAVFGGAAADTKYLGLFVLGLVALAAVTASPPGAPVPRWRRLARVAVAGGIVIAPWYGRIVAATGNPVFPFLPGIFGSSPWNPLGFDSTTGLRAHLADLAVGLLRLPWDAVFARSRLGGSPPYSPIFLLALPALLAGAVFRRRARLLLATAAAYAVIVLALRPDARYLLVALPLVCVALGDSLAAGLDGWARWRRGDERWLAAAGAVLALAIFLPGWCYAAYRIDRQGPLPVTLAEREAFLARSLPVYPSLRYLDHACGGSYTVYAVHAENMAYFASGRFLGDWTGPAAYRRILPANGDARLLFERLRAIGADHLLTVEGDPALPPLFSASFDGLFRLVYADGRARLFALRGTSCGAARGPTRKRLK
jgi:hypothetical protein